MWAFRRELKRRWRWKPLHLEELEVMKGRTRQVEEEEEEVEQPENIIFVVVDDIVMEDDAITI